MGYFLQPTTAPAVRPAPVDNFNGTAKNEVPQFFTVEAGRRFYSPELGRWLNRDPIGENGGMNLQCFIKNRPCLSLDLLGLQQSIFRKRHTCPIF